MPGLPPNIDHRLPALRSDKVVRVGTIPVGANEAHPRRHLTGAPPRQTRHLVTSGHRRRRHLPTPPRRAAQNKKPHCATQAVIRPGHRLFRRWRIRLTLKNVPPSVGAVRRSPCSPRSYAAGRPSGDGGTTAGCFYQSQMPARADQPNGVSRLGTTPRARDRRVPARCNGHPRRATPHLGSTPTNDGGWPSAISTAEDRCGGVR